MTAPSEPTFANAWEDEGRRVAGTLDPVHSALVIGRDAEAAAWVALGLARVQAERRRVAVADLVGEAPPLQALVVGDDPHGISDSFLYGVSLNKVARPADEAGNLFVLPSGSEAVAVEEIFRSDRWRRLASGFREVGALLLLVAHADTPGLDALAASVEGVVVAGDASGALPDAPPPLAVVAPRQRRPVPGRRLSGAAGADAEREPDVAAAGAQPARRSWVGWLAVAVAAAIAVAALALYVMPRTLGRGGDVPPTPADSARLDSVRADSVRADSVRRDSVRRDSLARARAAGDSARAADVAARTPLPTLTVANPGDSANATAYSVYVAEGNTPAAASLGPYVDPRTVPPVLAVTPVLVDGAPWYRLLVGAYARREQADSLLDALRRRGVIGAQSGSTVRAPYALLVADRVPASEAAPRVRALGGRGVAVYPLSRGDGTVALYAGAFELPQDAAWLARQLQSAGITPTLVYRTGRSL